MDNSINDGNVHPLLVFGGSCCQELTNNICQYMDIEPGKVNLEPFPNGETMVHLESDVRGRDAFVVVSVCRQTNPDERGYTGINDCLMELLIYGDALRRASANRITAVIPHFGYARQDRKAVGRTPITARLVADMITQAGFNRVLAMDLHADQIQGFFSREVPLDHLNAGQLFADYYNELNIENAVVLSADVGNIKKAEKIRRGFNFSTGLAFIDKARDKTGTVVGRRIGGDDVKGRTVLMLDDIISTAGTMNEGIRLATEAEAEGFYLSATHGEFVGQAIERLQNPKIKGICITDTIPVLSRMRSELSNLRVLSSAELIGEAMLRIHRYESISELLGIYG